MSDEFDFETPKLDESRNPNIGKQYSDKRELTHMAVYLAILVAVIWVLIETLIYFLPSWLTLEREQKWFAFVDKIIAEDKTISPKMQELADSLAQKMNLPKGSVRVFIDDDETVNAYATFGGNIVLYQGLLDKMPNEQAVAMVLAHEIAHVKHRDPLRATSRGLLIQLIFSGMTGGQVDGRILFLESLRYSRDLERAADEAAVHAVVAHYGDAVGTVAAFETLAEVGRENAQKMEQIEPIEWLSSHPDTQERIENIQNIIQKNHYSENANAVRENLFQQHSLPKNTQ